MPPYILRTDEGKYICNPDQINIGLYPTVAHVFASGHYELLDYVSEDDVGVFNESGDAPIHIAATLGHDYALDKLLELGSDVDAQNSYGRTALMIAAGLGNAGIMDILMDHADTEKKDINNRTALSYAITEATTYEISMLLDDDCSLHSKDVNGQTPFHLAVLRGDLDIISLILNSNNDRLETNIERSGFVLEFDAKDIFGKTALEYASDQVSEVILYYLSDEDSSSTISKLTGELTDFE
jgi:ankyrin repeat protein